MDQDSFEELTKNLLNAIRTPIIQLSQQVAKLNEEVELIKEEVELLKLGDTVQQELKSYRLAYNLKEESKRFSFLRKPYSIIRRTTGSSPFNRAISDIIFEMKELRDKYEELQKDFCSYLIAYPPDVDKDYAKLNRYIDVKIYLSKYDLTETTEITEAIKTLLNTMGFQLWANLETVYSSLFKRWFARSRDLLTKPEVKKIIRDVYKAIELEKLNKPQAEIDERKGNAIANLLNALGNSYSNAACMIGSILILKLVKKNGEANVVVKTLTEKELRILEEKPNLFLNPKKLLDILSSEFDNSSPFLKINLESKN